MNKFNLDQMIGGWFIGDFTPSLFKTSEFEVAIKEYNKNSCEKKHYHKIATEVTVIMSGKVKMNNNIYYKGDIIIIEPNESTDFEALADTITAVIKFPSVKNDKYLGDSKH